MTTKIKLLLQDLERNIPFSNQLNKDISGGNISWHIEHTLLTLDRIIDRLSETDSRDYQWTVSFPKLFVFATGIIPKGKAEAPPSVQPVGNINHETLIKHLAFTKEKINKLQQMERGQYFEHPYFGHLKLKQAIKFLEIHTKHHLKIIQSIKHEKIINYTSK